MRVLVHGCFYPRNAQRSTLRLLRRLRDGGTLGVPKHVGDLLTFDVYIFVHVIYIMHYVMFIVLCYSEPKIDIDLINTMECWYLY